MRARSPFRLATFLALALSASCGRGGGGDTPAPAAPEPEAPRAPVEMLVERLSRGGRRSFLTMAPDGSRVAPFEGIPADASVIAPSPDGRGLALVRVLPDTDELWIASRDGADARRIRGGGRGITAVAWSPDGLRLALAEDGPDATADIVVVSRDGSGALDVTPDPLPAVFFDRDPSWSPDGARIAFSTNRSGSRRIWVVNADGSEARQVLPDDGAPSQVTPAWSPDGEWIAFVELGAGGGVAVVRPDGSGYGRIPVAGDVARLAWPPGDGRLVFANAETGTWDLLALDPRSGAIANLTNTVAHELGAVPLRHVPPPPWRGLSAPQPIALAAPGSPAVAAGDVDGDGVADLLALAPARGQVRLALGRAAGAPEPIGGVDTAAAPRALAAADVSRDGVADAVVLGPEVLQVLRGGAGGLAAPETYPLTGDARALAVLDVDDDGVPEVAAVVARGDGPPFHVLAFAPGEGGALVLYLDAAADVGGSGRACAGDVTGEGWGDLVVLASGDASAVLLPGEGPVLSAPVVAASGLGLAAGAVPVCADLDGDRRADLVLLRPGAASLQVLRSTGSGLAAPEPIPLAPAGLAAATAVAAADLDRDGDVDLAVAGAGAIAFVRNLGDGRFAAAGGVALAGTATALQAADLDGDRWPDLAVADASGTVSVLWNLGATLP